MRRSIAVLCCLLMGVVDVALGQTNPNAKGAGVGIETNMFYGNMLKHTSALTGPIAKDCYGVDVNLTIKTYGRKAWEELRNYPTFGIGISYLNYNNPSVYGFAIGINPNITLPLISRPKFETTFRIGMGVGFVSKHYSLKSDGNTDNLAIGGHANNVSPMFLDARWKVNMHWHLQAGLNLTHISNASFQQPNLGTNIWGAHVGFRYFPVTGDPIKIRRAVKPTFRNNFVVTAKASLAFKESTTSDGPLYTTYIGTLSVGKRFASKNKVYAGVDYHYSPYKYAFLKSIGNPPNSKHEAAGQTAVFAGIEFFFNRVAIVGQMGYYVQQSTGQTEPLYQKIGANYYFIRNEKGVFKEVFFSALLKTHMATAELFEMGIGVSF